jgi:hypothetical protein
MNYPKIYFDEKLHKYTDEYGNVLTSVTTVIGKYVVPFDTDAVLRACVKIGKNPNHPKYLRYKGKTEKQILAEWNKITNDALDNGNAKHNYLEDVIKNSNNYKKVKGNFINDRIFTIPEIISNPEVGIVTLDKLIELGLYSRYPSIFEIVKQFVDMGWKLYSEIGVFNSDLLVSGLIDLLLVKGNRFFIIDWKTNKSPIMFESGYFEKDYKGNITDRFIKDDKKLLYPLNNLPASVGHKYSLQLSSYAYLTEQFGMELSGIILTQIRNNNDKEIIDYLTIDYYKNEVDTMFKHHASNQTLLNQKKLFIN